MNEIEWAFLTGHVTGLGFGFLLGLLGSLVFFNKEIEKCKKKWKNED